jgi:heme/copper-type cytochrome/quinol oxidase subunit 2
MAVTSHLFDVLWDEYILWSLLVGIITFGWLYHHSLAYRHSDGGDLPNVDGIKVGYFPKHNDDLRLEVAWTVLPFILIIYLTYISWAPLDHVWAEPGGEARGDECLEGESSANIFFEDTGFVTSECYHVIELTGQQWFWSFDCNPEQDSEYYQRDFDLSSDLCSVSSTMVEGYGMQPVISLKAGETYLLVMESEDVTHSPWFLELSTKEDVQPGQKTTMWLPIIEAGDSMILCAEYCGDAHSVMAAVVSVHE